MGILSSILGGVATVFGGPLGGALVSAGSSLIGGSKDRKAQAAANAANTPAAQVKAWEDAGINPEFGISQGQFIPQQAVQIGDNYAQAGAVFGDALNANYREKLKETKTQQENKKLRTQLDKIAKYGGPSDFQRYNSILPIPSEASLRSEGRPDIDRPFEVEAGSGGVDQAGNPVTNLSFGGKVWKSNSDNSDAEMVETRYGDIAQEAFGFGTLAGDVWQNTKPFRDDWVMRSDERQTTSDRLSSERLETKKRGIRQGVSAQRKAAGGGPILIEPPVTEWTKAQGRKSATKKRQSANKARYDDILNNILGRD